MEIECEFLEDRWGYHCRVTKAAITRPNVDIASFKGNHPPGKSNDDVTEVIFGDARVEYFPKNLQRIFPRIDTLVIENCGLKEISREDLIGLEKLECLSLEKNQLKSLPDDLFSNMPSLKKVWLGRNKIEFSSSKLIEPIVGNELHCFHLNDNTFYSRGSNFGCRTIQNLMTKIDKNYKPPTTQMIAKPSTTQMIAKPPTTQMIAKPSTTQMIAKPPTPQMIAKPSTSQMIARPSTTQMIAKPPTTQMITKPSTTQCGSTESEFLRGFNEFRLLGRFTDFVIVVDSKEFPVNKNVLATQSPVLAEMFEVKTNGRFASKLEISDLSAEAVEAFLDYLYERKMPASQNAAEIFKLAAKYEVAKLEIICEGIIHENLDESNAFEIFKLACGPPKSEKLKVAAFGKLQEKFGGELEDDLINDPHELQEIVNAKRHLDDLMNKSRAKRQRLV